MTSRRADALLTETMQRLLNALLPAGSYYHWSDDMPTVAGVFLESKDQIISDTTWREWRGNERKLIRRRVIIDVRVEETEISDLAS